ncbi:camk protein kinase [Nannochloropsis oceanica]
MTSRASAATTTPVSNPKGNGTDGKLNKKDKNMQKKGTSATTSDSATASYEGSSIMSIDERREGSMQAGVMGGPSKAGTFGASGAPAGVRVVAGYEIQDTLGKGMSGKVKRGYNHSSGEYVALKVIDKQSTPRRVLQMLGTEIAAMKALDNHPYILSLLHYDMSCSYPRKKGGARDVVLLALDLAEGGELFDFMMYTGAFSESIAKAIFKQLTDALSFCHERGIYHRDIKPENLLLDSNFQLKVADFGLAAMRASPEELLKTECGTRSYMAPEVLARQQYDGAKADCWSSGVVLFIMLSGNPPFQMARPGDWWFNQFQEGRPDRFWKSHKRYTPDFPEPAQNLLTRIFNPNPAKRPSVTDLNKDAWLSSSTLHPAEVSQELATRKEKIKTEKELEKERARRKKAAGQYGKGGSKDIDPDRVKHRDIAADGESPSLPESPAPSPPAGVADLLTNLYSAEEPSVVLRRAKEALEVMGGKLTVKGPYHLQALLPVDGPTLVQVDVKVYSEGGKDGGDAEGRIQVLSVTRKQGDPLGFQKVFLAFRNQTTDLHGEGGMDSGESTEEGVGGAPFGRGGPVPLEEGEVGLENDDGML